MFRKYFMIILIVFSAFLLTACINNIPKVTEKTVLFDNSHNQTAGNADWTIRGGFSDYADDINKMGYTVSEWGNDEYGKSQIDDDAPITYETLIKYGAYIIPEPNKDFTLQEQNDIIKYINDGGNVFFISDHSGSDRNSNGVDSVKSFNKFVGKLGFTFVSKSYSQDPITDIRAHIITEGVHKTGMWAGTTININNKTNVKGIIYLDDVSKGPYMAYGTYGKGKFVAIGDSSPVDDGTGTSGDKLYDGYNDYDDAVLFTNVIRYFFK